MVPRCFFIPKEHIMHKLSRNASKLILGLIGGLELAVVSVELWSIGQILLYQLAFVAVGVIIVVFKIAARIKKRYTTWFIGAMLSFILTFTFIISVLSLSVSPGTVAASRPAVQNVMPSNAPPVALVVVKSAATSRAEIVLQDAQAELKRLQKQSTDPAVQQDFSRKIALNESIAAQNKIVNEALATLSENEANDKRSAEQTADRARQIERDTKAEQRSEALAEQQNLSGLKIFERFPELLQKIPSSFALGFAIIVATIFTAGFCLFIELTMIASAADSLSKKEEEDECPRNNPVDPVDFVRPTVPGDVIARAVAALEVEPPVEPRRTPTGNITLRRYLRYAWPVTAKYVTGSQEVSQLSGWPLDDCQAFERSFFHGYDLEPVGSKFRIVPEVSRDYLLRTRRET